MDPIPPGERGRRSANPARVIVAIGSGKGGVGKSTITLNVGLALAQAGRAVGILDADVYGPNIPLMMNIARTKPATHWDIAGGPSGKNKLIEPVTKDGIKVMSTGFIVAEDQPIAWDAGLVQALLFQMLNRVRWGDLDYLLVDLPPGTADVQQTFARSLPLTAAVVVVTPQDVAHLDAKKAVQMFKTAGVRILGGVENMSGLACPHCGERIEVFHPVARERSIWETGIELLGSIPLAAGHSVLADRGRPVMISDPQSHQAEAMRWVASEIDDRLWSTARN